MKKTNRKTKIKNYDGIYAILAALFVMFSAMFNPIVSAIIAITALIALGIRQIKRN
jgi:hypothetical protein